MPATATPKAKSESKPAHKPQQSKRPEPSALEAAVNESVDLEKAAEEALEKQVQGDTLSPYEEAVFTRLGWDGIKRRGEFRRAAQAFQLMAKAGANQDYEKAKADAATAEGWKAKDLPELERQIEALEVKKRELEDRIASATGRVEVMTLAREQLRDVKLLPESLRRQVEAERKEVNIAFDQRLTAAKQAAGFAERVPTWNVHGRDRRSVIEYCQKHLPEAYTRSETPVGSKPRHPEHGQGILVEEKVDQSRFERHQRELTKSLEQRKRDLAAVEREKAEALEEAVGRLLDYHLDKL